MRTVTFADVKIVDLVNERYIALWNNHNSGENELPGSQPKYSRQEMEAYPEGGGAGNVRSYVVAPDGAILTELQGYWSAERFLDEAQFALGLTRENAGEKHRERAASIRKKSAELAQANPEEMKKPVKESRVRREVAALGLLAGWHEVPVLRDIAKALAEAREETLERGSFK